MILPMIDVPVSLIGTFVVMAAMGFTLNNLTLFGLVLAIGIVVSSAKAGDANRTATSKEVNRIFKAVSFVCGDYASMTSAQISFSSAEVGQSQ